MEQQSFTTAIAPLPLGEGGLTADDFYTRGIYISAQTQQPEACWTWLKYLSEDLSGLEGGFPARTSLAQSEAFVKQAQPGAAEVYQAYAEALQRSSGADERSESIFRSSIDFFWFFRAVDRALQGNDLERELSDAQTLTEQFLACVRGGVDGSVCAKQVDPDYEGWQSAEAAP
jgi:hypothetical protein